MSKVAIIIPCYNEGDRLVPSVFLSFIETFPQADLFFVNDGSNDQTQDTLWKLSGKHKQRLRLITLPENKGKANAVRTGMLAAYQVRAYTHIGYLDADLSTPPEEFFRLYQQQERTNADYISGSRIKILQNNIERSSFRHFTGRVISTILDLKFHLHIYDTQCGAKCFRRSLISTFCAEPFLTRWLFDVEVFLRIKYKFPKAKGIEMALTVWKHQPGSKISILSFFVVIKEMFILIRKYHRPDES